METKTKTHTTIGTIGERSDELFEKYKELYLSLKKRAYLSKTAVALAEHDLICEKLVYEFALEKLRKFIQEDEKNGKS